MIKAEIRHHVYCDSGSDEKSGCHGTVEKGKRTPAEAHEYAMEWGWAFKVFKNGIRLYVCPWCQSKGLKPDGWETELGYK